MQGSPEEVVRQKGEKEKEAEGERKHSHLRFDLGLHFYGSLQFISNFLVTILMLQMFAYSVSDGSVCTGHCAIAFYTHLPFFYRQAWMQIFVVWRSSLAT